MRARLAALALVLATTACQAAPEAKEAAVDLEAGRAELVAHLSEHGALTTVDVRLVDEATAGRQVRIEAGTSAAPAERTEVLEELARAGWHTSAFVPTEVRVSLVASDGATLDARDLGFARRGADAAALFDRYGPPAADESWRP